MQLYCFGSHSKLSVLSTEFSTQKFLANTLWKYTVRFFPSTKQQTQLRALNSVKARQLHEEKLETKTELKVH